jgi:tetratricopeptide (TPR) repeat protein
VLEALAGEFPGEAKYRVELASAYSTLGFTLVDTGENRPGGEAYRRAAEIMEGLASVSPAAADSRERLSMAYMRMGTIPGMTTPEAEQALRRAARLCEDLVAEFPGEQRYCDGLLDSLGSLGYALVGSGRHRDAEKAYRELIATYEAGGTSLAPSHRRALLVALNLGLAGILTNAGRAGEAVEVLRKVVALSEEAMAGLVDASGLRKDLTTILFALARALQQARRPAEAIPILERALANHDAAAGRSPGDLGSALARTDMMNDLGRLFSEAHRPAEARRVLQEASDLCKDLAARIPEDPALERIFQADCYFQWTRALAPLGLWRDAGETARKAVELYTSLAAQRSDGPAPQEVFYRWRLATSSHFLGAALAATGSPREAAEAYRRAVALRPDRAMFNNDLAWFLVASRDPPPHDPAEAVGFARKASEIEPTGPHIWNTLGVAHYRAREYRAAIAALKKSEELGHGREFGFNAFFLALSHWRLGERDEARRWFGNAVRWMGEKKPNDEELRRFRAEAEALIRPGGQAPPG